MYEVGFEEMVAYFLKRQNTFAQYILTRKILDLCKETVQRPGVWVNMRLQEQEGLDLAGSRSATAEAADREGGSEGG